MRYVIIIVVIIIQQRIMGLHVVHRNFTDHFVLLRPTESSMAIDASETGTGMEGSKQTES